MIDCINRDMFGDITIELYPIYDPKDYMELSKAYFIKKNNMNYNIDFYRKEEILKLLINYIKYRKVQMEFYAREKDLLIFKELIEKIKFLKKQNVGKKFYMHVLNFIPEIYPILPKNDLKRKRDWERFQNIEKYCKKRLA